MHIGIDLDNTVLDATTAHLRIYNQVSGRSFTSEDVNDFYIYRLYGWGKAERDRIYYKHGHDIHWDSRPYPQAVEIINSLYEEHIISIVTARPQLFRDVSIEWLKHHKIKFHNIDFVEDKLQKCMNSNIDVLIEDGPHYAEQFAKANKPIILYDQPYNGSVLNPFVYRASNWLEVRDHIQYLKP